MKPKLDRLCLGDFRSLLESPAWIFSLTLFTLPRTTLHSQWTGLVFVFKENDIGRGQDKALHYFTRLEKYDVGSGVQPNDCLSLHRSR